MAEGFGNGSAFGAMPPSFTENVFGDTFASATNPLALDPHSPEMFKQNIQMVRTQVLHLQDAASRALDGIQNAYHPGANPVQTESDIATLKQSLELLSELMRQTGLGALPLLSLPSSPPTEQQMMADVTQSINVLYARLQMNQQRAGTVANLLLQTPGGATRK